MNKTGRTHGRGNVRRAVLVALAVVATTLSLSAAPAAAASGRIIVNEGESIQAAVDAAEPGTTIIVRGDHQENVWVNKDGIRLIGRGATLTGVEAPLGSSPCLPFPDAPVPIVCATPTPNPDGSPAPAEHLDGFLFQGFTLEDAAGDGVATVFADNVIIRGNAMTGSGCAGINTVFSNGFAITQNTVDGSELCAGINVNASSDGVIRRNTVRGADGAGINLADVSDARVRRNVAERNCIGIVALDGEDGGYGVREESFPGNRLRIVANVASNNSGTCPFGPSTVGQAGIAVGGMDDVVIRGNTANDNAGEAETLTFGGVYVAELPNPDGSLSLTTNVRVIGNTATGNTTAAGPIDLAFETAGITAVRRNTCDVSFPDASACE